MTVRGRKLLPILFAVEGLVRAETFIEPYRDREFLPNIGGFTGEIGAVYGIKVMSRYI